MLGEQLHSQYGEPRIYISSVLGVGVRTGMEVMRGQRESLLYPATL